MPPVFFGYCFMMGRKFMGKGFLVLCSCPLRLSFMTRMQCGDMYATFLYLREKDQEIYITVHIRK